MIFDIIWSYMMMMAYKRDLESALSTHEVGKSSWEDREAENSKLANFTIVSTTRGQLRSMF